MDDFIERVKKWRRTASVLHDNAMNKDREECNYQLGKIAVCDMIIKDHERKAKEETSKEGNKKRL